MALNLHSLFATFDKVLNKNWREDDAQGMGDLTSQQSWLLVSAKIDKSLSEILYLFIIKLIYY